METKTAAQKISAFVVSYNRAGVIEACLRSLRFADELIVIDKGSTDETLAIAARYADRVITVPWTPTVEETRAFALSRCSYDFIVFLDDDECFTPSAITYLRGQAQVREADIYEIPSRHYVLGRHDERAYYWPESQVRAFWRGTATFSSTVHTTVVYLSDKVARVDTESGIFLHHLSHPSAQVYFEKANRYTSMADRHSFFALQELRPLRAFVHSRADKWLDAGSGQGDDYVDTVAVMRAMYDVMDAVKRIESSIGVNPEADFPNIVAGLQADFDRFSADTGIQTHERAERAPLQTEPEQTEALGAAHLEHVDAETQWRQVAQELEKLANWEREAATHLRRELDQSRADLGSLRQVICDRDEQAEIRKTTAARMDQQQQIDQSQILLLTRQVDSLSAGRDALSLRIEDHEATIRDLNSRIHAAALQNIRPDAAGVTPAKHTPQIAIRSVVSLLSPIRAIRRKLRPSPIPTRSIRDEIMESGLFDADFYKSLYHDCTTSGIDPLDHFILVGLPEGRPPSAGFNPQHYAQTYPDISGPADAVLHYIRFGRAEGRIMDPAGLDPSALPTTIAEIRASGLFDEAYYRAANPVVEAEGVDPLLHYLLWGFRGKSDIAAFGPMHAYLAANPDVRNAGHNPLVHWLQSGRAEGREPPDPVENKVWIEADNSHRLPDNQVWFELLKGEAYFAGHGFSFDPANSDGLMKEAVAGLARCQPLLTIETETPDVSIIIPVYGQIPFLLSCLNALAAHRSRFSVEIMIVDDASPAAAHVEALAQIPWIRLERLERNSGFIDSCNFGAERARGQTLVLLNSDTRVVDNWLDELIGSFSLFPKAGLVGSKLFNADGTLQEAGGIFWRDGSAWNYGRGDDPNHPKYCFARRADYVSGAAIAVPAVVWREMGGFNVTFRPAYCEDADLAFRLRRAGYETWYQPLSRVIHYEGKTHGRDLNSGIKAYQAVNLRRIAALYADELAHFAENGVQPRLEANRTAGPAMLILDAVTATPDRDAGSFVASRMMQAYRELGFSQTFLPLHDIRWKPVYSEALQRIGVECHYHPYTTSIEDLLSEDDGYTVVLAYRYMIVRDTYDAIRRHLPTAHLIFSNVDLHYLREEREAALKQSKQGAIKAAVTKLQELEVFAKVDCSLVHTAVEREIIQAAMPAPLANILEFPWIAEPTPNTVPWEDRHDVMFLGGFRHSPNIDAVHFFATAIWPLLAAALPRDARFIVVGDAPPEAVLKLASDRIIVTGYVADLEPYFAAARVFVAPLRFGAGIKGKLINALSHGVPSVATSIAAEGIGLSSGQHVIVADEAEAFAQGVLRVYSEAEVWRRFQHEGLTFVVDNFSWERAKTLCQEALDIADRSWRARQNATMHRHLAAIMAENGELGPRLNS